MAPPEFSKSKNFQKIQIQAANGQLEKPLAAVTFEFDFGDHTIAEHFVIKKNFTWPFRGLHFMRHNGVVTGTTHGLIHCQHLTIKVKSAATETSAKPQSILTSDTLTKTPMTTKQTQPSLIIHQNGTHQVIWPHWRNSLKKLNFYDIWQESSSHSK